MIEGLTRIEQETVDLLCSGLTNREIAAKRHRSYYTVKNTLHKIYVKLGVRNRIELMKAMHDGTAKVKRKWCYKHVK